MENRISINIPEDVKTAVDTKLDEIYAILNPYLVTVSETQKLSLLKIGDKTAPLVTKSYEYATGTGKEYVPTYLDVTEFSKDVVASNQLNNIRKQLDQLTQVIDDTRSLAANDAYAEALAYYSSVKNAAKAGEAKAKIIYDDLSQRFLGHTSTATTATNTLK